MQVKCRVYDGDIQKLLDSLDKTARKFDPAKYGLPPISSMTQAVYNWLNDMGKSAMAEDIIEKGGCDEH